MWWLFNHARCSEAPLYDYAVKQADPRTLRTVFYKYASVEADGKRYITPTDFVRDLLQMDAACFNPDTLRLFAGAPDQSKDGLISFEEFQAFEALLCRVDAKFKLVFELFDLKGKGSVSYGDFKHVLNTQANSKDHPFDFECEFLKRFFGLDYSHEMNYHEFTQLIQTWNREYVQQLYRKKAGSRNSITALEFVDVVKTGCSHRLNPYIVQNMMAAVEQGGRRQVSSTYCMAFYDMLENLGVIYQIFADAAAGNWHRVEMATGGNKFKELTKEEILQTSMNYPQVSPLQIEILFDILTVPVPGKGKVSQVDAQQLSPKRDPLTIFSKIHEFKHYEKPEIVEEEEEGRGALLAIAESVYRFGLGAVAGGCGAFAVYPIDLVKTRMQNQRSVIAGEIMYKNSWDCFRKVLKNEGLFGLYRGLLPQLVGVSPEKAIKLTTNDFVRGQFTDKDGEIRLIGEIFAGGCGGGAQVLFTNPIEIVKIRMQVAGEAGQRASAMSLAKELGFRGVYKGATACLLRDVPFSAIYFPCYANMKKSFADKNGYNTVPSLFGAAFCAGVPAAYLVTPADVIKTRLQVKARRGQQTYSGLIDCARKIHAEEGATAFFKGGPARIFRSSPQFGVTLLVYELLQRYIHIDFGGGGYTKTEMTPRNPEVSLHPDHIGGLRMALASFSGVETRFGLMFPKFNAAPHPPRNRTVQVTPPVEPVGTVAAATNGN